MNQQRIRDEQIDSGGIAVVLYLDVGEDVLDAWMEGAAPQVFALERATSRALWRLLDDPGVTPLDDEATRAITLLLDCGTDRQAWLGALLEGLLATRPAGLSEPDPFAGQNEAITRSRREVNAMVRRRPGTGEAADAVAEVERMLGEGGAA